MLIIQPEQHHNYHVKHIMVDSVNAGIIFVWGEDKNEEKMFTTNRYYNMFEQCLLWMH